MKTQIDFLECNTTQIYNLDDVGMLCFPKVKTIIFLAGQGYSLITKLKKSDMQLKNVTLEWPHLFSHKFNTRSIAAVLF